MGFGAKPRVLPLALAWLCFGCTHVHDKGPEAWYHEQVGGAISSQRPPPPGENDPYPNLATVPPKPAAADAAAWNRMTAGLMADRINARQAAALAPIPPPTPGPPAKPAVPPAAPEPAASAALVGASPPPAAPVKAPPPKTAKPAPVLIGNGPDKPVAPTPPTAAEAALQTANGQLPPLPTEPPGRPGIAPAPRAAMVPVTAAPPVAPAAPTGSAIDFARGSAKLNDAALAEVKAIAALRGDGGIAIVGYGDAGSSDAIGQADALGLGLSRAQTLATALVAEGVPFARLRLNAESAGRGASLRLLQ